MLRAGNTALLWYIGRTRLGRAPIDSENLLGTRRLAPADGSRNTVVAPVSCIVDWRADVGCPVSVRVHCGGDRDADRGSVTAWVKSLCAGFRCAACRGYRCHYRVGPLVRPLWSPEAPLVRRPRVCCGPPDGGSCSDDGAIGGGSRDAGLRSWRTVRCFIRHSRPRLSARVASASLCSLRCSLGTAFGRWTCHSWIARAIHQLARCIPGCRAAHDTVRVSCAPGVTWHRCAAVRAGGTIG